MLVNIEKNQQRKLFKNIRREMPKDFKKICDRKIFENVINDIDFQNAENVYVYVSTDIEVDTRNIIAYSLSKGKNVFVPRCEMAHVMRFYKIESLEGMVMSNYGILEPSPDLHEAVSTIEGGMCIVPALAFDSKLYRLGYGGGYYDKFLSENKSLFSMGLCYECCITECIAAENFDVSVDKLITENKIFGGNNE